MNKALVIIVLSLSAYSVLPAQDQTSADAEFSIKKHKQMYGIIHRLLFPEDSATSMLTLYSPGEFIGTPDENTPQGLLTIDSFTNRIPETSWISGGQNLVSVRELYKTILDAKELPIVTLTEGQNIQKREAAKVLYSKYTGDGQETEPSPVRLRYNKERKEILRLQNAWLVATPETKQSAYLAWRSAKTEYALENPDFNRVEQQIANLESLDYLGGTLFWYERKEEFEANKSSITDLPRTWLSPPPNAWETTNGWTKYTITSNQWETSYERKEFNLGASGSYSLGFISISGGGGANELSIKERSDFKNMSIILEVLPVTIMRPWMRNGILEARTWRWPANSAYPGADGNLSYGKDTNGLPIVEKDGRRAPLPILPTKLILVRSIQLKADWTTAQRDYLRKHVSGGGGVRIGPFKFGGGGGSTSVSEQKSGTFDDFTVSAEGIQVIGCVSTIIDQSPNPKPELKWPSDN